MAMREAPVAIGGPPGPPTTVAHGWVPDGDGWDAPAAAPPTVAAPAVNAAPRLAAASADSRPLGGTSRLARSRQAVADRLPVALRGASVVPSRRAVAGLVVLAVAVVAATGWFVLHNGPRSVAVGVRPVVRALPGTVSPSPTRVVLVDVVGKVRRPGVVTLPLGSRVADAVRAAGGLRPGADVGLLNLARPLTDGEQVLVGLPGAGSPAAAAGGGAGGSGGPAAGIVDLNTATVTDFEGLPGVGPVLAQRIVDWRTANGPFTSVEQLREVSGIGDRRFDDLKARIRV